MTLFLSPSVTTMEVIIMWIINKYGHAINTDMVARFRQKDKLVIADMTAEAILTGSHVIGETTVAEIIRNEISGVKVMEVR